jgi:hypothetical protein
VAPETTLGVLGNLSGEDAAAIGRDSTSNTTAQIKNRLTFIIVPLLTSFSPVFRTPVVTAKVFHIIIHSLM